MKLKYIAAFTALFVAIPANAAVVWTFNFDVEATGTIDPYGAESRTLHLQLLGVDIPAFSDAIDLANRVYVTHGPLYDPAGLGVRAPSFGGTLHFIDGGITGTNFTYSGTPCFPYVGPSCNFYALHAPTFSATFVSAVGGAGPVPEPATWAMFILGLGAIGHSLRSRGPRLAKA